MTFSIFHKTNPLMLSLGKPTLSSDPSSACNYAGTLLDPAFIVSKDSPTDKVLEKFFSAGFLDANYQLQAEAIQKKPPLVDDRTNAGY